MAAKQNNEIFVKYLMSITLGSFVVIGFFCGRILYELDRTKDKMEIMQGDILKVNANVYIMMKAQGLPIIESTNSDPDHKEINGLVGLGNF